MAVLHAKPVAPVIAVAAILRRPCLRIEFPALGTDAEVAAPHGKPLACLMGENLTLAAIAGVMAATGAVDPVVEPPTQAVDPQLLVAFQKAREERLSHVGPPVAIGVGKKQNLRCGGHQDAVSPDHHPAGKPQPLGKHGGTVIAAIAIGITKAADTASRLTFAIHPQGIVRHLGNPQRAIASPIDGHRVLHKRLGCDQFDAVAVADFDRLHCSGGICW